MSSTSSPRRISRTTWTGPGPQISLLGIFSTVYMRVSFGDEENWRLFPYSLVFILDTTCSIEVGTWFVLKADECQTSGCSVCSTQQTFQTNVTSFHEVSYILCNVCLQLAEYSTINIK